MSVITIPAVAVGRAPASNRYACTYEPDRSAELLCTVKSSSPVETRERYAVPAVNQDTSVATSYQAFVPNHSVDDCWDSVRRAGCHPARRTMGRCQASLPSAVLLLCRAWP